MNNLTPVFERETGQVILEGIPAGVAGEAPLVPVPGLELAFDRADGRLCRAVIETAGDGRVLRRRRAGRGDAYPAVRSGRAGRGVRRRSQGSGRSQVLSSDPGLTATLSSLARLDAARATSPVPPDSPWWAAEAAELAERGGLRARARAEAHQAVIKLLGQLDSLKTLPAEAVRTVIAAASIHAATDPQAAGRLRGAVKKLDRAQPGPPGAGCRVRRGGRGRAPGKGQRAAWAARTGCSIPASCPKGSSGPGCRPTRTCPCGMTDANGRVIIQALLAPGAAYEAVSRCLARLVDPAVRRVLAQATFTTRRTAATPPGSRPSSSSPSRWTRFRTAGSRWWRTSTGPSAAPRATGSGAPCAGPIPPFGPNGRRLDWPRTPPQRTGPLWPPRPGSTAGVTGRPPATPATPPWLDASAKPPWTPSPAPRRRPATRPTWPKSSAANTETQNGPGDRSHPVPGPHRTREPDQPLGSSTTTSTRRFAAESPGPTGSSPRAPR